LVAASAVDVGAVDVRADDGAELAAVGVPVARPDPGGALGGGEVGGGAAVGGFAALGADQVRDVEHEAAQLSPSGGQGPCALRGAVAGAGDAVDDGGQHDGDVGLLVVVAEVHRVG